jgi:hypothetical protein
MNPAQRRSLFSLYLAYFADYFSWGVAIAYLAIYIGTDQSPFTNLYWNTDIALGIAIACFPIGEVIGSPLLGGFSDSLGRRKILIGGLLASVLSLILCAIGLWSGCFLTFLLGQLLAGFFSGKQAMTQAAIAEIDAETKSQKLAFLSVLGGLAWITGPYVGNLLLGESFIQTGGFIWPSLLAAFICGVSLLCTYFFFKDTYRPNEPGPEGSGLRSSDRSSSSAQPHLYDTRPALVNFGEHLLCSSALLDRSKPSRFGATSATLLEPKICCPNSPDLTAHRIYREPPGLVNLEGHPSGPSSNDHSSSIWMQYRSPHDPSNLDHSEALQNSQNLTVRGIRTYSGGLSKTHFVIGGSAIFNLFFAEDLIDEAWITHIHKCYTGDAYFPIHFLTGWCKREFHQEKDFSIIYYKKEKRNGN